MKRFTLAVVAISVLLAIPTSWAQKKYEITEGPKSKSEYTKEHIIDVGDRPGHQLRVYEIRVEYPANDLAFSGVKVKGSYVRGMSDYTNWSGAFTTYTVYSLEDGSQIFSRSTGTTQSQIGADGTRQGFRYSFVETFVGGTKRFKGIRGQQIGSGARAAGANVLSQQQSSGEYWIEE
jgi:hypothetical protein